ncbi:hypothetical protein DL93DRAFT_2089193, partial [Clavulina sp. PMI_390]
MEHVVELLNALRAHAEALVKFGQVKYALLLTDEAILLAQENAPSHTAVDELLISLMELRAMTLWDAGKWREGFEVAKEALSNHQRRCNLDSARDQFLFHAWRLKYRDMEETVRNHAVGSSSLPEFTKIPQPPNYDADNKGTIIPKDFRVCKLLLQARQCYTEKDFGKAADLLSESLPHLRVFAGAKHNGGDLNDLTRLADATRFYAVVESNLGHEASAVASAAEHLTLLKQLAVQRPDEYSADLARGVESFKAGLESIGRDKYPEYANADFLESLMN